MTESESQAEGKRFVFGGVRIRSVAERGWCEIHSKKKNDWQKMEKRVAPKYGENSSRQMAERLN